MMRSGGKQRIGVAAGEGNSGFQALTWLLSRKNWAPPASSSSSSPSSSSSSPSPSSSSSSSSSSSWLASSRSREGLAVPTVVLIHVYPTAEWIITPVGVVSASEVSDSIVARYKADKREEAEKALVRYTTLCQENQVSTEVCLIEGDYVGEALLDQIFKLELTDLVLGTSNANPFARALRGKSIPEYVVGLAPRFCTVIVVQEGRPFSMKIATEPIYSMDFTSNNEPDDSSEDGSFSRYGILHPLGSDSFTDRPVERDVHEAHSEPHIPDEPMRDGMDDIKVDARGAADYESMHNPNMESEEVQVPPSVADSLHNVLLDHIKMETKKIVEIAKQMNVVSEAKLAEERAKCEKAYGKLKDLTKELERESQLRKEAEERALVESIAKDKAIVALERLKTTYSFADLKKATDNFAAANKLGEGAYGQVFKGKLHHMTVAIKRLSREGVEGDRAFQREVTILGNLHHPHMVMLLGACAEKGCLVYEYMANGSLADRLACKDRTPPLPWYVRFRICAEIATALLFLHSRPEPIVHRDLKPGNILLDHNFVSKVSDVGIAKLVSSSLTENQTLLRGTPGYVDPEYLRDGVVGCELDLYALGIVMLQILTGHQAVGIIKHIKDAIDPNEFHKVLDKSAGSWPLEEAKKLARLALQCAEVSSEHRPKLETEILPILNDLRVCADTKVASMASISGCQICYSRSTISGNHGRSHSS